MTNAEQVFADKLAELDEVIADYQRMKEIWLRERRMILDTLYANAELRTVEVILSELERSSCPWERWPAADR
jgi:hypothetical protein